MPRNLERRLAEVERRLRDVARREQLSNCNCLKFFGTKDPDKFEEEMDRHCPAHGFRDLGKIFRTVIVPTTGILGETEQEEDPKVEALIATYQARRARHQADREFGLEDDSDEF